MRDVLSKVMSALAPALLLGACSQAPNGAEGGAEDFSGGTATKGIAFSFAYDFLLPPRAVGKIQRQHVTACEQLGSTRCRVSGITYDQQDADSVSASLDLLVAPPDAYRFASEAVDVVEAAKGEVETANVRGSDAGGAIDEAKRAQGETQSEMSRVEARLQQKGLSAAERRDLMARLEEWRKNAGEQSSAQGTAERSLAVTPIHFGYGSQGTLKGENRFVRAAAQSWDGLQTTLIVVMVVLGYLAPWALLLAALIYLARLVRRRFPRSVTTE